MSRQQVDSIKKSDFVVFNGRPVKVVDLVYPRPRKHGQTKVHWIGTDIFTDRRYEDRLPSPYMIRVPKVTQKDYTVVKIDDNNCITLLDEDSYETRSDIKLKQDSDVIRRLLHSQQRVYKAPTLLQKHTIFLLGQINRKPNPHTFKQQRIIMWKINQNVCLAVLLVLMATSCMTQVQEKKMATEVNQNANPIPPLQRIVNTRQTQHCAADRDRAIAAANYAYNNCMAAGNCLDLFEPCDPNNNKCCHGSCSPVRENDRPCNPDPDCHHWGDCCRFLCDF
ncbi:unnamed protein product [Adineta steineri]|uniref:Uncharacterized protein n=1 Tax=Adineta steineri TaxID=433720 RepID=A0A813Q7R4_9BILA|nr:unnamed protein product [Adineta steineri]CAF4082798.1 unnamed protein product [Adineta steineri]